LLGNSLGSAKNILIEIWLVKKTVALYWQFRPRNKPKKGAIMQQLMLVLNPGNATRVNEKIYVERNRSLIDTGAPASFRARHPG
jgi:hypothetical protein